MSKEVQTLPDYNNFQIEVIDEDSGELYLDQKYRYIEGNPRGYRCDMKNGGFNIEGTQKIEGNTFTFQPIAWRFFKDDIMQLGQKTWAEVFFIDKQDNLAVIMFHSATAENLQRLAAPLFYERKSLMDVVITCELKEHTNNKIKPAAKYFIGEFTFETADPEVVREMKAFVKTVKIFRRQTLQDTAVIQAEKNYFNPLNAVADLDLNEDS